jgi:hypothetical protein
MKLQPLSFTSGSAGGVAPLRYDYHWSVEGGNAGNLDTFVELDELTTKWSRPGTFMRAIAKAESEYRAHNGEKGLLP